MAELGTVKPLRASSALAASGAFDADPTAASVHPETRAATLLVTFTRGSSSSAFALRVEVSPDDSEWYAQTASDGTTALSAPFLRVNFHALEYRSPVPASNDPLRLAIPVELAGAKYVRVSCAEYGDTANPGTLAASLVEGT